MNARTRTSYPPTEPTQTTNRVNIHSNHRLHYQYFLTLISIALLISLCANAGPNPYPLEQLKSKPRPEAIATVIDWVRNAPEFERDDMVIQAVRAIADLGQRTLLLGVSSLSREFPELAPSIASVATERFPEVAEEIAARLIAAAPKHTPKIITRSTESTAPHRRTAFENIATAILHTPRDAFSPIAPVAAFDSPFSDTTSSSKPLTASISNRVNRRGGNPSPFNIIIIDKKNILIVKFTFRGRPILIIHKPNGGVIDEYGKPGKGPKNPNGRRPWRHGRWWR